MLKTTLLSPRSPRLIRQSFRAPIASLRWNSTGQAPTRPCPSCSAPLPLPTSPCPKCSTLIRIPSGLSHHSLLNVSTPVLVKPDPPTFDIPAELSALPAHGFDLDPRDLRNRMLGRQRELHPDKYSAAGAEKVELARELSGMVNTAYETLGSPLRRAEYILSVNDLAMEETESLTDPGLLAEILEAREELEEATTPDEVDRIRQANHEKVEKTIASIKEAFSSKPPNFAGAKILSVQLKYWIGLEEAAKEWTRRT